MIEEQALATVPPPLRTGLLRSLSAKTWVEAVPEAAYRTGLWRFPGPVPFLVHRTGSIRGISIGPAILYHSRLGFTIAPVTRSSSSVLPIFVQAVTTSTRLPLCVIVPRLGGAEMSRSQRS